MSQPREDVVQLRLAQVIRKELLFGRHARADDGEPVEKG